MKDSYFVNSTVCPTQVTWSPRATWPSLAQAMITRFSSTTRSTRAGFHLNNIKRYNRLSLLGRTLGRRTQNRAHGGGRYCLVASAERNGMRLISVVMGTKSTTARTKNETQPPQLRFPLFRDGWVWPDGSWTSRGCGKASRITSGWA